MAPRVTAGAIPVPLSVIVCGDPLALSLITKDALRAPLAPGVKVRLRVQLELGDRVVVPVAHVPTELVTAKSPAFVPLRTTLDTVNGPVPLLVMVNIWAVEVLFTIWELKITDEALRLTPGTVPVPLSATGCGDPLALSAITSDALLPPATWGTKFTRTSQDVPALRVSPTVQVPE
jgi:hypothetical protein